MILSKAKISAIERAFSIDPVPDTDADGNTVYAATANVADDGAIDDIRRIVGNQWTVEWSGNSNTDANGETSGDILITSEAEDSE